jgi:SAM-dependent methyltransferase
VPFTSKWYQEVLYNIPPGSRILDVGIGTGAALVANAALVREKNLRVVGVDYDADYIEKCKDLIASYSLSDNISATCCSFYDYKDEERFDHVYFSGSFMILPDAQGALRHALELLRDTTNGRLYFTQTFELARNAFLEKIKPILTYFTSIDFGSVTYVEEFEKVLQEAGVVVVSSTRIEDGKASRGRESRLVVARSSLAKQ